MALIQEIWIQDVQEVLYPPNSILLKSTDHSAFVHYHTVHIPNAGTNGAVTMNLSLGGALTGTYQRTDNDKTYTINSFSILPIIISDLETYQINYDKRKSITYNALKNLETIVTDDFLYSIAPDPIELSGSVVYTSGALQSIDLASNYSGAIATGSRSAVTMTDIFKMATVLDMQNVPNDDKRVMIVPSNMFNNELLQVPAVLQAYQLGAIGLGQSVVSTGVLARVAGFELFKRPSTVVYNMSTGGTATQLAATDSTRQPATIAATDSMAILAWHPSTVSHAKGNIDVYYQEVVAQAYGSILSFNVWCGSSKLRYDGKGIAALIQHP